MFAWMFDLKASRLVEAKKYGEAVEYYKELIKKKGPESYRWEMIALCYEWSDEPEKSTMAAKEALLLDGKNFTALQLLTRIALKKKAYTEAKDYVVKALEVFPEPFPEPPDLILRLFDRLFRLIPRLRTAKEPGKVLKDANKENENWLRWTKEYLAWYEQEYGERATPTVH